ncbi:MAG: branched-chain amino acid ABC transporter substrate-binding protein, partial [Paracoccaceae bacterium]|nr:branched-chain amino acid ABC transporter substrate-binding protein [Paracoccaceae bacterium]
MQAAGSSASADFKDHIFDVANAPGIEILPGELARGLELIAAGEDIDYVGASAVELIGPGESAGSYQEIEFADGVYSTINYR